MALFVAVLWDGWLQSSRFIWLLAQGPLHWLCHSSAPTPCTHGRRRTSAMPRRARRARSASARRCSAAWRLRLRSCRPRCRWAAEGQWLHTDCLHSGMYASRPSHPIPHSSIPAPPPTPPAGCAVGPGRLLCRPGRGPRGGGGCRRAQRGRGAAAARGACAPAGQHGRGGGGRGHGRAARLLHRRLPHHGRRHLRRAGALVEAGWMVGRDPPSGEQWPSLASLLCP